MFLTHLHFCCNISFLQSEIDSISTTTTLIDTYIEHFQYHKIFLNIIFAGNIYWALIFIVFQIMLIACACFLCQYTVVWPISICSLGGATYPVSPLCCFAVFQKFQNTGYLSNITLIFDRHTTVVTLVRFGCDYKNQWSNLPNWKYHPWGNWYTELQYYIVIHCFSWHGYSGWSPVVKHSLPPTSLEY